MTDELLARVLNQAIEYGELMLSIEEFADYWHWTTQHPAAAFSVGPGQLVEIDRLRVRVIEL